jgi:PAS domain S-box-containing protein
MERSGLYAVMARRGLTIGAFDAMIDDVALGVYVANDVEGCVYANDAMLAMFGCSWPAFAGFGWSQVVDEADRDALWAALADYAERGEPGEVRYRIRTPEGTVRTVHSTLHPLRDASGELAGTVAFVRDVSLEDEGLRAALDAQRAEVVMRLSTRVAHQVNNTLQGLLSAEQALRTEALSADGGELLDHLRDSVQQTAALAAELAGLARPADDGAGELDRILARGAWLYEQHTGERIALDVSLRAPGCRVGLSSLELEQILLHVLSSARCRMGGGRIGVRSRVDGEAVELELDLQPSAGSADPLPVSPVADQLGQAAVRALLNRVGGSLAVEERRIVLRLPRLPEAGPVETVPPARILLVDDHPALRQSLAHALALHGHTVHTAASVIDALEVLTAGDPLDLIVTDLLLPDGDGSEVAEAASRQRPPVEVVYMSGYERGAVKMVHGVDPNATFLQKPFTPADLLAVLAARD